MKHLKLFEEIHHSIDKNIPEVGDYVFTHNIVYDDTIDTSEASKFLSKNLGKIINLKYKDSKLEGFIVEYELEENKDLIEELKDFPSIYTQIDYNRNTATFLIFPEEITYWSDNKEELKNMVKVKLDSGKFNL